MTDSITPFKITAFGLSDVGLVRKNNEDSFLIANCSDSAGTTIGCPLEGDGSLLLVADGMGGVQAGEVASRMAVDRVARYFFDQLTQQPAMSQENFVKVLQASIQEANRIVFEEGRNNNQLKGMGTTLTAAAIHGQFIFFAQLGDSRAYLARNGSITQMTRDQNLVAQLVASGSLTPEEAKAHPQRNVILQALGIQPQVDVIISSTQLKRGDQLVMCTDGLSGKVDVEEIKELLERWLEPKATCQHLVELARERGGDDNITVIVSSFDGDGLSDPYPDDIPVYNRFREETRRRFWPWRRS